MLQWATTQRPHTRCWWLTHQHECRQGDNSNKTLVLREGNQMVACVQFPVRSGMIQHVCSFGACWHQSIQIPHQMPCQWHIHYTKNIRATFFTHSFTDSEIQEDCLVISAKTWLCLNQVSLNWCKRIWYWPTPCVLIVATWPWQEQSHYD